MRDTFKTMKRQWNIPIIGTEEPYKINNKYVELK